MFTTGADPAMLGYSTIWMASSNKDDSRILVYILPKGVTQILCDFSVFMKHLEKPSEGQKGCVLKMAIKSAVRDGG